MRAAAVAMLLLAGPAMAEPRSGIDYAGPQTRAMQADDSANPGLLWVETGRALWTAGPKPCAGCHGEPTALKGVAARYPRFDEESGRPVTLEGRINLCRIRHQGEAALAPESEPLLALAALVGLQSRGLPMAPDDGPRLVPSRQRGAALFIRRMGQLNLSCANCHDANADGRLGGSAVTQGHSNGYPLYRLEWQAVGSLQRRLRACMTGVRAEPFAPDAPEWTELALFLAWRARGLRVETPAVRP